MLVYLSKGNNIIFKQVRVGKDKQLFTIYKFRTMNNNEVTLLGKYIRKLGFDELPQLINIIRNEMNIVGPRPLTSNDIERLDWNNNQFIDRWSVKPGITGMAQLTSICDPNVSMKNDLFYVKNKCWKLDAKILFKSVLVPFLGKRTK